MSIIAHLHTKDDPHPGRCRRLRPHASQCHPLLGGGWSSGDAASAEPSPPAISAINDAQPYDLCSPLPILLLPPESQPAVFIGVILHHLGSTSLRRLRRLLRFSPRPPPSCVLVSSVVAPDPDDDDAAADDDDDDAVSAASTATTDAACGSSPP